MQQKNGISILHALIFTKHSLGMSNTGNVFVHTSHSNPIKNLYKYHIIDLTPGIRTVEVLILLNYKYLAYSLRLQEK